MSQVTSAHGNGRRDGLPPVPSIPLADDRTIASGEQSVGNLVKDATTHLSTLVRAEVELAKSELGREVKKVLLGSAAGIAALVLALYGSFFLFFTFSEFLSEWLHRWAAFGITTLLILAFAAFFAFFAYKKFTKIKAPTQTIDSVKETAAALRHRDSDEHRA
jgi:uncharacterized membrane protein YqjE